MFSVLAKALKLMLCELLFAGMVPKGSALKIALQCQWSSVDDDVASNIVYKKFILEIWY